MHFARPAVCSLLLTAAAIAAVPTTNPADLDREIIRVMSSGRDAMLQADDLDKVPLDAKLAEYLKMRQPVLDLMRQAATMPHADWGPIDGDITKTLGSLNGARAAVRVTWLAACQYAADGDPEAAVDDLLAGFALARHIGQQPLLVCHLVEIGAESGTIDRLSRLIPGLPADVAKELPAKLDALPPYIGWPAIIDGERAFGKLTLAKQMAAGGPYAGSPQAMADGLGPIYDAMKGKPGELPTDLQKDIDAAVAKMPNNPFAKIIGPSFGRAREGSAMVEAKFEMLRTAAAIAVKGPGALADSHDPFGDGPFVRTDIAGGYTLTSKLVWAKNGPVTLKVAP